MRSLIIFVFLLLSVVARSQVNPLYLEPTKDQADSIRAALGTDMNDTLRMAAYREMALYYLDINSDSAQYFVEKDLPLTRKLKLKLWEADALDLDAIIAANKGNYLRATLSYQAALAIAENKDSEKNIWRISKFTNNNLPEYARLSMLSTIQSDASSTYTVTGNKEQELQALRACLSIARQIDDKTLLSQGTRGLASFFLQAGQLDSAILNYQRSLAYSQEVGYNKYRGTSLVNLGDIYLMKDKPDQALQSYLDALASDMSQHNFAGAGRSYRALASYYHSRYQNDSALYFARLALTYTNQAGRTNNLGAVYSLLATIFKEQGNTDSAYQYLQWSTAAKDTLMSQEKVKQIQHISFAEQLRVQELEKEKIENRNRTRTYGLIAGLFVFLIVGLILYRSNRQQQKSNKELALALSHLKSTQAQLVQSEKMASLGELTAGIAHEIQNPLNFINNFSDINKELSQELVAESDKGNISEVKQLAADINSNSEKISHHGKRADAIVKGMLQHSRSGSGKKELTDINALCEEYLRLAYHGLRAKDNTFNAILETDFDPAIGNIPVLPQDLGRVILNLINNAFYAVAERKQQGEPGYEPRVTVSSKRRPVTGKVNKSEVLISIADNGTGIPPAVQEKMFQPFFTTKPTGQGTGLGLSMSYDIVSKGHGGELLVESREGEYTRFTILIPL